MPDVRVVRSSVFVLLVASCSSSSPPQTQTTIGAAGGDATSPSGALVRIPGGALSGDTVVTVTIVDASTLAAPPAGTELVGKPHAFTPHGLQFSAPVAIVLPSTETSGTVLRLDDERDTTWERVENVSFDGQAATFRTSHFSIYAVARGPDLVACCGLSTDECALTGNGACDCGGRASWEAAECKKSLDAEVIAAPDVVSHTYGPPIAYGGHVYWADGTGRVSRIALQPGATVQHLYAEPNAQVTLTAVGPEGVFVQRIGTGFNTIARMDSAGLQLQREWFADASEVKPERGMLAEGFLYVPAHNGTFRVNLSNALVDRYPGFGSATTGGIAWVFGQPEYCIQSPGLGHALCGNIEIDFKAHTGTNVGSEVVQLASSATAWLTLQVDQPATFPLKLITHRTHETRELAVLTSRYAARAPGVTSTHAYFWDDCHVVTSIQIPGNNPPVTKDIYFNGDGPCVRWMHVDESYAYVSTWVMGLLRVPLAQLRGE